MSTDVHVHVQDKLRGMEIQQKEEQNMEMQQREKQSEIHILHLVGGLREEDAAGALAGLQQLLHQNPVQRRDQTLRHSREEVLRLRCGVAVAIL